MAKNRLRIILHSSKLLFALGSAVSIILACPGQLLAQTTLAPPPDGMETPGATSAGSNAQDQGAQDQVTPGQNPPAQGTQNQSPSGQNPPDENSLDQNSADQSRAQVPGVTQNPLSPPPTNIPSFPILPGNPVSPYTSSSGNPQSPQLTAPSLYLTGANDLSQVTTSNALRQAFSAQGAGSFYSEPAMDFEHPPIERLRLGPFDLKAALVTSVVADDNLRTGNVQSGASNSGSKGDVSFAVTPALLLEYGDHEGQKGFASLVYAPTFTRFVHHSDENSDDYQTVALNAAYPFQRLSLNLSQTYSQTTGVNTDSNFRTTQTSSATLVGATYQVDDKISTSTQVQEVITSLSAPSGQGTGGGEGETTTSLNNSLTYSLSEKLNVGPSLNIGIDKPDDGPQQTFEQALIGLNYAATEKIGLYAQAGVQFSQYEHAGSDENPIFGIGVGYTPFDSTSIEVNASQSLHTDTSTSSETGPQLNQTVVGTSVGVSATQRIAQRFYLNFDFNYTHDANQGNTGGSTAGGSNQDNMTYRTGLSLTPTEWSAITLYYQYLSNTSDQAGSTYHDNQVGLSVSVQF